MPGLIEIAIVIVFLAAMLMLPSVKVWFARMSRSERRIVIAVVLLLVAGQLIAQSRKTFPFVRWSMYTEIFENQPIEVGKFQALHADGTTHWINPVRYYPSISRNLHHRVAVFMSCYSDDELSEPLDQTFEQFMAAIGQRYAGEQASDRNPLVEVRAVLQSVDVKDGKVHTENRIVKTCSFRPQNTPVSGGSPQ